MGHPALIRGFCESARRTRHHTSPRAPGRKTHLMTITLENFLDHNQSPIQAKEAWWGNWEEWPTISPEPFPGRHACVMDSSDRTLLFRHLHDHQSHVVGL